MSTNINLYGYSNKVNEEKSKIFDNFPNKKCANDNNLNL
jgi:hypothetical protein